MLCRKSICRFFLALVLVGGCLCVRAEENVVTDSDLVAGRFLPLPEHLRNAGFLRENYDDTRKSTQTFEDVVVAGLKACQAVINVYSFKIKKEDISALYFYVLNKHPELFYVETSLGYSHDGTYAAAIAPRYITTNATAIASQQAEIDVAREQALAMIPAGATDLEKALILHDYIATHCDYAISRMDGTNVSNIYGALVERSAVCAGYSQAYEYLLSYVGIPCDYVSSSALNHAWNMVSVNGQKYHVDVTFDDPVFMDLQVRRNYVSHENFMRSDTGIVSTDHSVWDDMTTYSSSDTRYEEYFWQNVKEQIPCLNGKAYVFDWDYSGDLFQYDLSTGVKDAVLLSQDDAWWVWNGGGTSVVRFGKNLIYSGPEEFRLYDIAEGTSKELPTVSCSTENGYIYGLLHESANLIAVKIAQDAYEIGEYSDVPLYPVTGISLDQSALSLKNTDASATLTATVLPANATYPDVRWSSSNPSVVTVDDSGIVTVVGLGDAVVTAESKDNGLTSTCSVTVYDPYVAVRGVSLEASSAKLVLGGEMSLHAQVLPENSTNPNVTWSSSDEAVVTVDANGRVNGVGIGKADISVTTEDGSFEASCAVTVSYPSNTLVLHAGWNLVAFQMHPTKMEDFAETPIVECKSGEYLPTKEIARNQAYWIHSSSERLLSYEAEEFQGGSVVLSNAWQFIGISSDADEVDLSSVECWKWANGGFKRLSPGEALELGKGYLVRFRR